MPNSTKSQKMRAVSFRMLADVHQDYLMVAQSHGVDMSALLNWVLVEMWPVLLLGQFEYRTTLARALAVNLPPLAAEGTGHPEVAARLNALIGQLQDLARKLEPIPEG